MPCWLREQTLRKFSSKDLMSDERKVEIEIINYSDYEGKWIAFKWIELQMLKTMELS